MSDDPEVIWSEFLRLEAEAGGPQLIDPKRHRALLDEIAGALGLTVERVRRVIVDRIAGTGAG